MARIIQGGAAMFNAVHYGRQSQEAVNFLTRQFENVTHHLSEAGRAFYQKAQEAFEYINSDHATRLLRAAGRALDSLYMPDRIQPLSTIGHLQHAPPVMQRWIMAEPTLRKLHIAGRVEGYSDSYLDLDPGRVGDQHYDYQRVMQGVVVVDEEPDEDGNRGWTATQYLGGLLPDDRELEFGEQLDIMETWRHVRKHVAKGDDDPTSRYNAQIG